MPNDPKPQPASAKPSEYQLAAIVARHVEIQNVALTSWSAEAKARAHEAIPAMLAGAIEALIDWKTAYSFDAQTFSVLARFSVRVSPKSDTARELVNIVATYDLGYRLAQPPPEAERDAMFTAFANVNGIYNAWPYLRELVQSSCSRMGLPPVILPVYRAKSPPKRQSVAEGAAK